MAVRVVPAGGAEDIERDLRHPAGTLPVPAVIFLGVFLVGAYIWYERCRWAAT
jgi:hypothetical protein